MSRPIDTFVAALDRAGCKPKNGAAHCPAHEDKSPSLTFSEGDDGRVLVNCFAGCSPDSIVAALGLKMKNLFPAKTDRPDNQLKPTWISITPVPDDAPTPTPHPQLGLTTAKYEYLDSEARLLGYVGRWDAVKGKDYRPLTFGRMSNEDPSKAGWGWKSWSGLAPLFGLDLLPLRPDAPALVTEGEKAALAARELFPGHVVVTSPGGSKRADKANWGPLKGRAVTVFPDNDEPGREYAADVARLAKDAGAESVSIVQVPENWPSGWDVADDLPEGVTVENLRDMVVGAKPNTSTSPIAEAFMTARELSQRTPENIEWVVEGFAAVGSLTELDAKIKLGKTTLLLELVRCVLDGELFLDCLTAQGPVVYLTEQPATSFRAGLNRAGLADRNDLYLLSWADVAGVSWADVMAEAVKYAQGVEAVLLVVDTLGQWAGLKADAENNAGAALDAVQPLQLAAAVGLCIILARHDRKGGGAVGESARGSSAFGGAVDIIIQLGRLEGKGRPNLRILKSLSRFDETPDSLVIAFEDGRFVAMGDEAAVAEVEAEAAIRDALPTTEGNAVTEKELQEGLKDVSRTTAQRVLRGLHQAGEVVRVGEGKKGSAYRYFRPQPEVEIQSAQVENTWGEQEREAENALHF